MPAQGGTRSSQDDAEHGQHYERLAQHVARLGIAAGANELGNLYSETNGEAHADAAYEPCGACDQADRGRRLSAEAADHGSVDVLHGGVAHLSHDGGH